MLQKLLIVFCTIFVLSACGGDLDLGPDQPPRTTDNNDVSPPPAPVDPEEPRIFTFIPFSSASDIHDWSSRCVGTCNASAALSWNAGEEVLVADPQWTSNSDQLEIYGAVNEVSDMA